MSFLKGLLAARSHISFLVGLAAAVSLAIHIESRAATAAMVTSLADLATAVRVPGVPDPLRAAAPLDAQDLEGARVAWRYFENNYRPETGFVDSVDKYASTTLWDLGSYAMGLLAARDLGIIDEPTFDGRAARMLESLGKLSLVEGRLPNKAYDTVTLAMVDYNRGAAPQGIGWSAIDVARLAVPLQIIAWRYPKHTPAVRAVLSRWKLSDAVSGDRLQGAVRRPDGHLELVQEGRLGYEQYAARGFFLLGREAWKALRSDESFAVAEVSGQKVAYDARMPAAHGGTHNAVVSEPYVLEAAEFGLDGQELAQARAVYRTQENRWRQSGMVTAVSEDNLDRAPWFVYGTVINDGKPWAVFAPGGAAADGARTLSVKAALGWASIFGGEYAGVLRGDVAGLRDDARGWYSGRYEADGSPNRALTANTNGIVLELAWFRARGPLLRAALTP